MQEQIMSGPYRSGLIESFKERKSHPPRYVRFVTTESAYEVRVTGIAPEDETAKAFRFWAVDKHGVRFSGQIEFGVAKLLGPNKLDSRSLENAPKGYIERM